MSNDITQNRSGLKEFLASIATISGDLSNITAPPFVLADNSTVEIPQYWADHPYLWAAPATEENPEKRALLVLKNFLGSLRGQQYGGRKEEAGVKKPLNAFLGELFLGSWDIEELGQTRLISEQVSHHPPITACYLWNERVGIRAEGFTEQEITFNGNVVIKQMGYAIVHLDKYDEDYLLPLPNIKVKGLLTGTPHPELYGDYSLICSNGYVSHIHFEGKSLLGSGQKNGFHARFFHRDNPSDIIYTIEGAWNSTFVIKDARSDKEIETFDVRSITQKPITVPDLSEQDPWESRKAWQHVIAALRKGDMKAVVKAKSEVENGQRQMRKDEAANGTKFEPIFFKKLDKDPVFDKLVQIDPHGFTLDPKAGIWKVDRETADTKSRPFHPELTPANQPRRPPTGSQQYSDSSSASIRTSNSSAAESTRDSLSPPQQQVQQHQSGAKVSTTATDTAAASAAAIAAPDASAADAVVQNGTLEHAGRAATSAVDPRTTATAAGTKVRSREPELEPSKEQVEEFLRRRTGNVH